MVGPFYFWAGALRGLKLRAEAAFPTPLKKRFAGINRLMFSIPIHGRRDRDTLREIMQDLRRAVASLPDRSRSPW